MKQLFIKSTWIGLLGTALILTACGGGGGGGGGVTHLSYTGNTDPAAIDGANAQAVGVAITEGVSEAIGSETTGSSNPFGASLDLNNGNSPLSRKLAEIGLQVLHDAQSSNLPVGATYTSDQLNAEIGDTIFCGGSISITDALANGNSESGTISFNSLCFDMSYIDPLETGNLVINGSMTISVSGTTETVTFTNMSVSFGGETFSFSGTVSCSTVSPFECSTLYVGSDGETYMVSSVTVTGDDASGYYVNATFSDPVNGVVTVTTNPPITFNCPSGAPDAGTIAFSGGTGSGTITFRANCTGYDGTWDDGITTGVFSGDWV